MRTEQQLDWLSKLSATDSITILPFNPRVKEVFEAQRALLQSILGSSAVVLHRGASAWGISGKGDVDIYIPVAVEQFDGCFERLRPVLGEPGSHYPHERVRWNRQVDGLEVEIFIVNQEAEFYLNNVAFWHYIETHPDALAAYQNIKEEAAGTSSREYYTRKVTFINAIMRSIAPPG